MKIETKHNVWDKVFFLKNNKIEEAKVIEVYCSITEMGRYIKYTLFNKYVATNFRRKEENLFKTKQELTNNL